jgi:hypothetical protein
VGFQVLVPVQLQLLYVSLFTPPTDAQTTQELMIGDHKLCPLQEQAELVALAVPLVIVVQLMHSPDT